MRHLAIALVLVTTPVAAQSVAQQMWEQIGQKFGELIRRKNMNCPEGKFAAPKGEDAYGKVYQVFCGPVGVSPLSGQGELIVFRLTFAPTGGGYTVAPWTD